jgi:hypothetical protein
LEKLKIQRAQLQKVKSDISEYEDLLFDVKSVMNGMKDKINNIEIKSSIYIQEEYDNEKNTKTFTKQIEYLNEKSNAFLKDNLSEFLTSEEKSRFRKHNTNLSQEDKSIENTIDLKFKNFKMNTNDLYQNVIREIRYLRNNKISNFWKSESDKKKIEKEKRELKDLIAVFEEVIYETEKLIEEKNKKDSIRNLNRILEELNSIFPSIKINRLSSSTQIKDNDNSIMENVTNSTKNYSRIDVKLSNMIWSDKNTYLSSTLDMVKSNIAISKQNNILMQQILKHSKIHYSQLCDKVIKKDKFEILKEINDEVEVLKQNSFFQTKSILFAENVFDSESNLDASY